jgi:hypothetical protein
MAQACDRPDHQHCQETYLSDEHGGVRQEPGQPTQQDRPENRDERVSKSRILRQ